MRIIELGTEHETVDLGGADRWYLVLTSSAEPVLKLEIPSPGATTDSGLVEVLLSRRADPIVWRRRLSAELLRAFAGPPAEHSVRPTVSVLVCTHRRPQHLPTLLDALERLEPAPDEVIVVDNDPGDADCREIVERSGARYVREDRRGQDNARNAGLAVARGDVVAFTDDDCVPSVGWLAHVAENFADPLVGVTTGPGFPWALDTPAQELIERQGGFMRGLDRRVFDWRVLAPIHAGAAGAGANMMIRRSALGGLAAPWPPELGPGTPTESGDDTYVLSRFLAAGYRIVYDPRQWFQHQHRDDWPALHRAVRGYGIGSMCMLLKSLAEDGETEAPRGLTWIARRYVQARWRQVLKSDDGIEMAIAAAYLKGAAQGPKRLRASRRTCLGSSGPPTGLNVAAPRTAATSVPRAPRDTDVGADVSVVVALEAGVDPAACLNGLMAGTVRPADIITVGPGTERWNGAGRHVRCPADFGVGQRWAAGAAEATGRVVLFLNASMTPDRALVAAHARRHEAGADLVVGRCYALPADDGLASSWLALESRPGAGGAPAHALRRHGEQAGNVSVGAEVLQALGSVPGEQDSVGDLARRVADRGGRVVQEGSAAVAVLIGATPSKLRARRWALPALALLERMRQRSLWARVLRHEVDRRPLPPSGVLGNADLDLAAPIPSRDDTPCPDRLDVVVGARRLGDVLLVDRPDAGTIAERVTAVVDRAPHAWRELAVARGWVRPSPPTEIPGRLVIVAAHVDATLRTQDVVLLPLSEEDLLGQVRGAAVRLSPERDWLLVAAPGLRVASQALDDVAHALPASRIGGVCGSRSESPLPSALHLSRTLSVRETPLDYVLVRASVAAGLSDAEVTQPGLTPRAALLWLAETTAQAGWLVGSMDVRGLPFSDDVARRNRDAEHRRAYGWWLGARARMREPGPGRRAATIAAGVELLSTCRDGGTKALLHGMSARLGFGRLAPNTSGGTVAPVTRLRP